MLWLEPLMPVIDSPFRRYGQDCPLAAVYCKNRDFIAAAMTPDEIAEAHKLARGWTISN